MIHVQTDGDGTGRIEESQDPDAIKNAVEDYLEQNPVEVPVQPNYEQNDPEKTDYIKNRPFYGGKHKEI